MRRLVILWVMVFVLCSGFAANGPKPVQVHGFLTKVTSPYDFEVEGRRVTCTHATFTVIGDSDASVKTPFKPGEIRFGREIDVTGPVDVSTQAVAAATVMFASELGERRTRQVKSTALIERPIEVTHEASGASGAILADGRRIRFSPTTLISFDLNEAEKTAAAAKPAPPGTRVSVYIQLPPPPMRSIDDATPDVWVTYEGVLNADNTVDATRIVFRRNDLNGSKIALLLQREAKVSEPDYKAGKDGEVTSCHYRGKIVADQELQGYVQALGQQLVPEYQKSMPDMAGDKLHFRFYVVREKRLNIETFPDGLVLASTRLIASLQNEAQLAAILAHSISEITQEHERRRSEHQGTLKNSLLAASVAVPAAGIPAVGTVLWGSRNYIISKYQHSLEAQADRISLEVLWSQRYDVREAAEMWRIFAGAWTDSTVKKLWYDTSALRAHRPYVMSELSAHHSDADYIGLKVDSPQFQKVTSAIRKSAGL